MPIDCYGRESEIGHNVIVIGGASTGAETALYLAENGHKVTLISRKSMIFYDNVSHGVEYLVDYIDKHPNIKVICPAKTIKIDNGNEVTIMVNDVVESKSSALGTYMPNVNDILNLSENVKEIVLKADTVVFSAGVTPCVDECYKFAGLAPEFFVIGDSNIHNQDMWRRFSFPKVDPKVGGDVKHCTATAYAAAMSL
jgi:thioredoxin reductase